MVVLLLLDNYNSVAGIVDSGCLLFDILPVVSEPRAACTHHSVSRCNVMRACVFSSKDKKTDDRENGMEERNEGTSAALVYYVGEGVGEAGSERRHL